MPDYLKHHKELDEKGEGRCSVPMWAGGLPVGLCDKVAYGFPEGRNGGYDLLQHVPFLACHIHGGPKYKTTTNCEHCKGTGFVDKRICPSCDGRGYAVDKTRGGINKMILEPPKGCKGIDGYILVITPSKKWLTQDGRITTVFQQRGVWATPKDAEDAKIEFGKKEGTND